MKFKKYLLLLFLDIALIYLYCILSRYWTIYGGVSSNLYKAEIPILLFIVNILRPWKEKVSYKYFIPYFYMLALYCIYDFYQKILKRIPIASDLNEIDALYTVDPNSVVIGAVLLTLIIFSFIFLLYWNSKGIKSFFYKSLSVFALIFILSTSAFQKYCEGFFYKSSWDTSGRIKKNGRIMSIFQKHFEMNKNFKKLSSSNNNKSIKSNEDFLPTTKLNFYLVVLESYIDPRKFDLPEKVINEINSKIPKMNFDLFTSPAFGGSTVKTEFELLTGHPSLGLVNTHEFNIMKGSPISSWVTNLKKNGYFLRLVHGAHSGFYNGLKAYESMGFDLENHHYLWEWDKYHYRKREQVFDGDIFDEALKFISSDLKNKNKLFTYIKGMYGHIPLWRDLKKRPNLVSFPDVPRIEKMINQFIYRTVALDKFIKKLSVIDPNSFVIVVSDHLPSLHSLGKYEYQDDKYSNIYLSYFKGEQVHLNLEKLYELPVKLNKLVNDKSMTLASKKELKESYMKLLWESIQSNI